MFKQVITFGLVLLCALAMALGREGKYLKKAVQNVEKGNLKNARHYYLRALAENPESYEANLGIGLMLCEFMSNYSDAVPYLEKALHLSGKDTLKDLAFALAQCYHHGGEYAKAIYYYKMLDGCVDYENEIDLSVELQKRIDDCNYGLTHVGSDPNVFIVNAGRKINTDMPEYVPVLTPKGELIFTSKRKDTPREELNYLDAKYFESMYISRLDSTGFKPVRRYTFPDHFMKSHFAKYHESIISISPDGTRLFTFSDSKLFEINLAERMNSRPRKLKKTINFNYYQNHAYVSRDGRTLYFTSDARGGIGGNDIYRSDKDTSGQWGKPVNLGAGVNTTFDEESPFLSDDGQTLYFSSRGHAGFGNFDVYQSKLVDGTWSKPENLGAPINTPGHDIFLVQDSASAIGYFSSSRNGGFGDMDIYKIIYVDKIDKTCPKSQHAPISLNISDEQLGDHKNRIEVVIPKNYKALFYEWRVDGQTIENPGPVLERDYLTPGHYHVESKLVALCDTCLVPIVSCLSADNDFSPAVALENDVTTKNGDEGALTSPDPSGVILHKGRFSDVELASMGFNTSPVLFDFNKSELRVEAIQILAENVKVLKRYPELKLDLTGHSDTKGSEQVNAALSKARAKSVRNYLLKNGVRLTQIRSVKGKGSSELANRCDASAECTEAEHQQNRRVTFTVRK